MKFILNPTPDALTRARAPVRTFLAFGALLLLGSVLQRALQGGFDPLAVEFAYRPDGPGAEALWAPALWEEVHLGAFLYGFLVLMLGSVLMVSPLDPRPRAALVGTLFGATLLDLLAPLGVALGAPGALRVIAFGMAVLAIALCLGAAALLFGTERR
jgi:hypothetical protein